MLRHLAPVLVFLAAPLNARHDASGCGTTRETSAENVFLHRQAQRARLRRGMALASSMGSTGDRDIGNVAIIDDSGGVVEKLNQFNLDQSTLTFTPSAPAGARYRYTVSGPTYDAAVAAQGSPLVALGDDDSRQLTLPFAFSFFGATYTQIFLNSDGNLTFGRAESSSSQRSAGRMTGGPPRISPLFDDLDPSLVPGSVRYQADAGRAVFTWSGVPEYGSGSGFGTLPTMTFQVRLYPDGRIQCAYNGVNPSSAVVGIAPGFVQGTTSFVSFHNDPSGDYSSAVIERFGNTLDIDVVTVAQRFYQTHEDAYDYLVIYNNMGISAMSGALAYESTVRSASSGHGVPPQDHGVEYGSASRLRAVLNMGMLSNYAVDVNGSVQGRELQRDTPLTVLGHEAGHLFNAFASIRDPNNPASKLMLGYGGSHWSFLFDSEASLDEGEQILDRGAGASPRFVTAAITQGYSPLDQYLMGFRAASDVAPVFAVTGSATSPLGHPLTAVPLFGNRLDIAVDDVIAAEGRRTPDYRVAQRRFRFAFILIVPQASTPPASQVQQIETYRQQFPAFYSKAATANASADTTLNHSLKLSLFPAGGVLAGGTATGTFTVLTALRSDLTIQLQAPNAYARAPAMVTIPAGATAVSFSLTGVKSGVEELLATPADSSYETAYARVQVADASTARLALVSGGVPGTAPTVVRLTDVNGLPYPGERLTAAAQGGSVSPSSAATDAQGQASFAWTAESFSASLLRITADSAPAVAIFLGGSSMPVIRSVVNAASFEEGVSPGAIETLFGSNLAGATLFLGSIALPLLHTSDSQINFYVPAGLPLGAGEITVLTPSGMQLSAPVSVNEVQPGIFAGGIRSAGAEIHAGDPIEIYCTGLGPTVPAGGLQVTAIPVSVFIGGISVDPSFSGLAPGHTGLYQVNAQIPPGLAAGPQGVIISIENAHSNEVQIQVR
jgi:uncharacterized protein (TIGR03437 family)